MLTPNQIAQELKIGELLGPPNQVEQKNAPSELYVAGDIHLLDEGPRVSLIGSRRATEQAIAQTRKLAVFLAERNVLVVSGLAKGVDTAAHTATIDSGGKTVAVLATPLDQVSPKSNTALQDTIMREHLAISQFPSGSPIQRKNFLLQSWTMALLSDATVIVEAGDSSVSVRQGWEAHRLGRRLFIAKSVAENPRFSWPKEMMHYGATVLSDNNLQAFFESLPLRSPARLNGPIPF